MNEFLRLQSVFEEAVMGRDGGEFGLSKDINKMISALPELNNVGAVSQVSWPLVDIKFMRVKYVCNVADIYLYKIEDSAMYKPLYYVHVHVHTDT